MQQQPILLDRRSAAAAIGISVRSLDYLISSGKLRTRRLGKRILIPRTELERLARADQPRIVPAEPKNQ